MKLILVLVLLGLGLSGFGKEPPKTDEPKKPDGPGKPDGPSAPAGPPSAPTEQPGQWGTGEIPDGWDPESNGFWIGPDCDIVLEGALFEPLSRDEFLISAISEPTLSETLQAAPDNTVYGFISYLMDFEGWENTLAIAEEVMRQANPLCADIPEGSRPAALQAWLDSFVERIRPYVEQATFGF